MKNRRGSCGYLFAFILLMFSFAPEVVLAGARQWTVASPETMFPPFKPGSAGVNQIAYYEQGQDRSRVADTLDGYLSPTEVVRGLKAIGVTDSEALEPRFVLLGPKVSDKQLTQLINSKKVKVYPTMEEAEAAELAYAKKADYEFKLSGEKCAYTSMTALEAMSLDTARKINPQVIRPSGRSSKECSPVCGGQVVCAKKRTDGPGYDYTTRDAFCRAQQGGSCPSATACAAETKKHSVGTFYGPDKYLERDWNYSGRQAEVYRLPGCNQPICLGWLTKERDEPVNPKILKEMQGAMTSDGPWSRFANSGFIERWGACAAKAGKNTSSACPKLAADCLKASKRGPQS